MWFTSSNRFGAVLLWKRFLHYNICVHYFQTVTIPERNTLKVKCKFLTKIKLLRRNASILQQEHLCHYVVSNNVKSIREDHDLQIIATSIISDNNYEDRYDESCLSFLKAKFVLNSSYKLTVIHHLVLFVVQPSIKPFRCCCVFLFLGPVE